MATHPPESATPLLLSVRGVSFSFSSREGTIPVLDRISFDVPRGSWATIIGPSGCGKTTLLRILSGLLSPGEGFVEIGLSGEGTLSRAAYMPQSDTLLPWRTALENAVLAAEVDRRPLDEARAEARALFGRFGLGRFERLYPSQLSGGMRQRIALIRTFLAHRELLLLDEPLGSLDALSRIATQAWLLSVWEGSGKTVLLVTHDVEEGIVLSDRIVLLSPRPARVARMIRVDLPRLRRRGGEDVTQLKGEILDLLAAGVADA
jgi:ABC-type nitrate/sulfonate/bicarbonate transport system ATPase subunit